MAQINTVSPNVKIPVGKFQELKRKTTAEQVDKLVNSQKYQDHYDNPEPIPVDDDEDFTKDWEENEEKIFD